MVVVNLGLNLVLVWPLSEAGLALANITDRDDLLVSVFQVRESLALVQQFTADRERVREAVMEATGAVNTRYTDATDDLVAAVERDRQAQERRDEMGTVSSLEQGVLAAQLGQQADISRMAVDALRFTQSLQREQQGNASLYSLLALSRQQQSLAGRKTIRFNNNRRAFFTHISQCRLNLGKVLVPGRRDIMTG